MAISGWEKKYNAIIKEFGYDKQQDHESAMLLNLIIKNPGQLKKIRKIISKKSVFVVGAGPSLSSSIQYLKKYSKIPKVVADSAAKPLLENKIKIDIVVTDLDDHYHIHKICKDKDLVHLKLLQRLRVIGHVRYSTIGKSNLDNAQPLKVKR